MVKLEQDVIEAAEAIIKRGNDVEIRRKGNGYIVLEVQKKIKYSSPLIGAGKGQSEPLRP